MAERLHVAIARAGICSRREAEKRICQGRVTVNGKTIRELGTRVDPDCDEIEVNGRRIARPANRITLMLNKPKGVVTTSDDPQQRKTVVDLVQDVEQRLFPVGRLDYHTEGLLLMTNDGRLSQLLQHPRHGIEKTYQVKVKGIPENEALERLRTGIVLKGRFTAPARVKRLSSTGNNAWLEIVIREGRNRQIRRMCTKIGHPVMKLKRIRYGPLSLGSLKSGSHRRLSTKEIERLYKCCGSDKSLDFSRSTP
jgi:23S rRNA pseudouridine2605 synthase